MSTSVAAQQLAPSRSPTRSPQKRGAVYAIITLMTACSLVIHGYHPYAEDGGLNVAGIKWLLDPTLYAQSLPFVVQHLRFSFFAPIIAGAVRVSHLSLPSTLLLVHLASLWVTLFAVWLLAERCYATLTARLGAVALVAATLTLPVAGTSLILMDPYLTGRSLSLPCALLALAGALDLMRNAHRGAPVRPADLAMCVIPLLMAAAIHPLMAGYALGNVLLLLCMMSSRRSIRLWGTLTLCGIAILTAAIVQITSPPETAEYLRVAATRYYWFLSQWRWYELFGLIAPLAILALIASGRLNGRAGAAFDEARANLARMAVVAGSAAIVIAIVFAREDARTHMVARLQPLRCFCVIYLLMILFLGATLGERVLRRSVWRWIAAFALIGGVMFFVQRSTYPSSAHIEWPATTPPNQWEQAFLWVRLHTPQDALFALDADYIHLPGEDAQSFRAIAERSSLPDYSKDGGEASDSPELTPLWTSGQQAQIQLSEQADNQRLAVLRPFNVTWIILRQDAQTSLSCPYRNDLLKVCRLP